LLLKNENEENPAKSQKLTAKGQKRRSDEKMSTEKVRSCDGTTKRKNENEKYPAKSQQQKAKSNNTNNLLIRE